nr:MAG TPA: hypothetical protein [Caudoviricetes sp.]
MRFKRGRLNRQQILMQKVGLHIFAKKIINLLIINNINQCKP